MRCNISTVKRKSSMHVASWSSQFAKIGVDRNYEALSSATTLSLPSNQKRVSTVPAKQVKDNTLLKEKLRAANRGGTHQFRDLRKAIHVVNTSSSKKQEQHIDDVRNRFVLQTDTPDEPTSSTQPSNKYLKHLSAAAKVKSFKMPVNGVPGTDVEEYCKDVTTYAKKQSAAKGKRKQPEYDSGIRYICGVPQPPKKQLLMGVQKSSKQLHLVERTAASSDTKQLNNRTALIQQNREKPKKENAADLQKFEMGSDIEDDFIDDTSLIADDNWKSALRSVTKYDPRKFKDVPADKMESSFTEICNEEKFSKFHGDREDKEELILQAEKEARRQLKNLKRLKHT